MLNWLRQWLWYFLSAFSKPMRERLHIEQAEEQRANLITLSDRTEIKREAYLEWSKPENIILRQEAHDAAAADSLARAKRMLEAAGIKADEEPIPPLDTLPEWMRNQSPSMIRRMLKNGFEPEC